MAQYNKLSWGFFCRLKSRDGKGKKNEWTGGEKRRERREQINERMQWRRLGFQWKEKRMRDIVQQLDSAHVGEWVEFDWIYACKTDSTIWPHSPYQWQEEMNHKLIDGKDLFGHPVIFLTLQDCSLYSTSVLSGLIQKSQGMELSTFLLGNFLQPSIIIRILLHAFLPCYSSEVFYS